MGYGFFLRMRMRGWVERRLLTKPWRSRERIGSTIDESEDGLELDNFDFFIFWVVEIELEMVMIFSEGNVGEGKSARSAI